MLFCYTPFHVFNAINVKNCLYPNDEADLCLFNGVYGKTDILHNRLAETRIFNEVFYLENVWWAPETRIEKFLRKRVHIKSNKKIKNAYKNYRILKKRKRKCIYDEVWSYGSAMEMYIILGLSLKRNPNTKYLGYEEGEGSYRLPCTNVLKDEEKAFISNHLKLKMPEQPEKMLLYLPLCASSIVTCKIEQMPKVSKQLVDEVYSRVWDFNEALLAFDVFLMASGGNDQSFSFSIYNKLKSNDSISIAVKPHPRFTEPFNGKDVELLKCGTVPWEIVCGKIDNLDSKLLIGVYSTALVTAKSLYGLEPYIIFLNDMDTLNEKQRISSEMKAFLETFIQTYSDQSKLFFPKNMDELIECINNWYNRERLR